MPRAIWTGTVGFGLVQIPVALHVAEDHAELDMTLLDKRNFSPVGYERVNKKTGKEVAWENIVKGYEHSSGKFVVLTDADFADANVEATRQIDILDFVELSEVDPLYIERPYYLAPLKAGKKSYALLREVLQRSGKAGIGKVVIRTRQHLAAVVAHEEALVLLLLRFADELRDSKGDITHRPLLERKSLLRETLSRSEKALAGAGVRFSAHVVGSGPAFFANACELGLEGTIAKRGASTYRAGRGRDWLKIKCGKDQEFAIAGYTEPGGSRSHFGALLLATRESGRLRYAGKVGTGFSAASLADLHRKLARLKRAKPALENPPQGAEARGVTWVEPQLVAQIVQGRLEKLRHDPFERLTELEQRLPTEGLKP